MPAPGGTQITNPSRAALREREEVEGDFSGPVRGRLDGGRFTFREIEFDESI